ncbi:4-hydroxyphenylpyruvate dioxygenase [Betaproteobacteria bacterium GR16-43]|nr:4-hydroxyphenylpyruvate dioxygenase [Betaproteobacteria bacterium GR16-43]
MTILGSDVREGLDASIEANPAGFDGIEFIEYSTPQPQALGQVLELLGFRPIARHRSREVLLYRQGGMNIVVNGHRYARPIDEPLETPQIAAVAFRVKDAAVAYHRAIDLGAWPVASHVELMELKIPAIHGVGTTRIYLVDRYKEFSIYSVDFVPIPGADPAPPAIAGLHWFGLVQYVAQGRLDDWTVFYRELFGFTALPDDERFGILPKGRILRSPCANVHLQLVGPEPGGAELYGAERLQRIGLGTPDVLAAVKTLQARGVEFHVSETLHIEEKGALTRPWLGGVMFELVRDPGAREKK